MTASKRSTAVGLPQHVFLRLFAVHRQRTATHMGNSTPARHSSAAQFVSALLQTVSPKINCIKRINSQVPSVISRLTSCATRVSSRGPSLALRAIHLVLRLRRVAGLCSSNVSDPANRLRKIRKKKFSAVPLFRSGHMSAICARLRNKRKWELRG